MSARTSREVHAVPACETSLTGSRTEWQTRPAAAYPPGYPRLCTTCFGPHVPGGTWNEDGTAEYDHTQATDTLVCSTMACGGRRYHLPGADH